MWNEATESHIHTEQYILQRERKRKNSDLILKITESDELNF